MRGVGGEVDICQATCAGNDSQQMCGRREWGLVVRGDVQRDDGYDCDAACCRRKAASFIFGNSERGRKPCEWKKLLAGYIRGVTSGTTTTAVVSQNLNGFLSVCRCCYDTTPRVVDVTHARFRTVARL